MCGTCMQPEGLRGHDAQREAERVGNEVKPWTDAGIVTGFRLDWNPQYGYHSVYCTVGASKFECLSVCEFSAFLQGLTAMQNFVPAAAVPDDVMCRKCRTPFDSTDQSFDGRARYHDTPYCRFCTDICHDSEIADHRCIICA